MGDQWLGSVCVVVNWWSHFIVGEFWSVVVVNGVWSLDVVIGCGHWMWLVVCGPRVWAMGMVSWKVTEVWSMGVVSGYNQLVSHWGMDSSFGQWGCGQLRGHWVWSLGWSVDVVSRGTGSWVVSQFALLSVQ